MEVRRIAHNQSASWMVDLATMPPTVPVPREGKSLDDEVGSGGKCLCEARGAWLSLWSAATLRLCPFGERSDTSGDSNSQAVAFARAASSRRRRWCRSRAEGTREQSTFTVVAHDCR